MFPIHIDLGFKVFYFYEGFYFLISIIVGILWSQIRLKKHNLYFNNFDQLALISLIGAIAGARIFHSVFWETDSFINNPLKLITFWEGGLSITGGIVGGIGAAGIYCYKKKLPFFKMYAIISAPFLAAQAIGRVGCFLNGDAFGTNTNVPWAVRFPKYGIRLPWFKEDTTIVSYPWQWSVENGFSNTSSIESAPMHATQLYEVFADIFLMLLILIMLKYILVNKKFFKTIFFVHTGGYAFFRFLIEFIRADRSGITSWGLSYLQIGLLLWFLISLITCFIVFFKERETKTI